MKKILWLFCALPLAGSAQELLSPQKRCATAEVLNKYRQLHPGTETDQQFESWLSQKRASRMLTPQTTVVLPVVFHIIYNGEAEGSGSNISQAVVQQQILQLNKDYANLSNSPYAVAANTNVQFALAQTDPSGNVLAQPGIDRVNRNTAGFTAPPFTVGYASASNNYLTNTIKPATIWDPNRYINIWVLQMESGVLGIATFPASSGLSGLSGSESDLTAGVAVGPTTLGSIFAPSGCSSYTKGKTLTHEMGHFLGLRHIWGDANCGDDFCGDTPVHQAANFGVPAHPKSNSCGTADEMFENYMDYCDDVALNTFTAGQVSRIQTVLANSPRRNTLATSTVGLVPVTATNRIAFSDCTGALTVSETGTTGTYPRYRDLSFLLNAEDKATGNATLTVTTGGTAVNGFHYQVLTPSISFASGDNYKTLTVRIFDNALIEGNRTLVLGYTISGTGISAGSSAQTMTLTITDDDNVIVTQNPITLLSQDFETSTTGWNTLSTSGMPNLFRVSSGGNAGGSGNCAYISNGTTAPYANTYTKTVSGAAVYRTPLIDATGMSNLQLTFKYRVWGEVFAGTNYDYGRLTYATQTASTSFINITATGAGPYVGTSAVSTGNPVVSLPNATFANNKFYLGFYWENDNSSGSDPALNIDDIVLTGTGTNIETGVATSYGYDLPAGTGINIYRSTAGKAIARITNASVPVNGLIASITQSGSGQQAITTSGGTFQRTQKVIQLTPAAANSTVTYQATLYFTAAELSIWGAANIPNLKILKVRDGVSLSGILTAADAVVVTPASVADNSATSGYIGFTGNFTGFSQFMLVSANFTLPVNFISFTATPAGRAISLDWSTSGEKDNQGFIVERSTNGSSFTRIGWVDGKGTTGARSDYRFTDSYVQPNTVYYYRLKQVDMDRRESLSEVRQALIKGQELILTALPNPAHGEVKVFVSGATGRADLVLYDAAGRKMGEWKAVDPFSAPYTLSLTGVAKGYYTLTVHLKDRNLTTRLIVE